MGVLTVICWRDIPAQVTAREGRRTVKAMLPTRFQVAIDRAATRSGQKEMDAYLAAWRRVERPCGANLDAEVAAEITRLEAAFPRARLAATVAAGGMEETA